MGKRLLFFFSPTSSEKKNNNLISILYSISLYYILDTPPLQLKNVYYTYIYICANPTRIFGIEKKNLV